MTYFRRMLRLGLLGNSQGGGGGDPIVYTDYYADSGGTWPWYNVTTPSAMHVPATNTTWYAWEATSPAGAAGLRHIRVRTHNHATDEWSAEYVATIYGIVDDDHGVPSLCRDADGYVHVFYGAHGGPMFYASTRNVDDPSEWRENGSLSGQYTYPHPFVISGVIYLFMRDSATAGNWKLVLRKTSSVSAGVPTFGSATTILDYGTDSRVYMGNGVVSGVNIHFVATRADNGDNFRRNVYYYVYETDTGDVRDFDDTTTIDVLDLPVDLTESNTSFRLFEHTSTMTCHVAMSFDTDGHPHVIFADGSSSSLDVKHIWHNGTAWQSAVDTGYNMTYRHDGLTIWPKASGVMGIAWAEDESSLWTRGGNVRLGERSAAGAFASATTIAVADTVAIDIPTLVQDGIASARMTFGEIVGNSTAESGALKTYAYGDSGIIQVPAYVHTRVNTTECETLFDRFDVGPSEQRAALYDKVFSVIKSIGIAKFDAFFLIAAATETSAMQNLIKNDFNLTAVGGYTFTADIGFQGNGSTGQYRSGFVPSTASGAMTLNSAHIAVSTKKSAPNASQPIGTLTGGDSNLSFLLPSSSFRLNSTSSNGLVGAKTGYIFASRYSSTQARYGSDTTTGDGTVTTSGALPSGQMVFAGAGGNFSDQLITGGHWGSALTLAEHSRLHMLFRSWELAVGAGKLI